ncbi:MAG: PD-(D/E)XK nuclease family protein [Acidimicrobiia bacterium]|jgi:RecB family exonuclease
MPPARSGAPRLLVRPHGAAAREALWDCIAEVRGGDPLAPVTVAVPTTYAGLSLRRDAGRRPGGLVNVRFLSLNRVAELLGAPFLAAPGRVPLTATRRAGAIRAALHRVGGPFRDLSGHPATTRAFAATLAELDAVDDAALARIEASGARAAAVVAVAREVRALVADTYTDEDQLRAAAAMVREGTADLRDIGTVVCFAPGALGPGALELLLALGARGHGAAVLAATGDPEADAAAIELRDRLAAVLGPASEPTATSPVPHAHAVLSCADADDEARVVVREVVRRLEGGVPLHRVAVTYRSTVPYARLLHEHFGAAGIPVHGPRPATLRESVAGRTLLALLRLRDADFRRDDIAALFAVAPLVERPRGPLVPGARWDQISCRANVVGGLDQWDARLARYREEQETRLARQAVDAGTLFAPEAVQRAGDQTPEHATRLARFVAELGDATEAPPPSWTALSAWALGLLDRYLDPRRPDPVRWPQAELDAHDRVTECVRALAQLEDLGAPASVAAFVRAVEDELDASVGYGGTFGDGVLVAPLGALRGTEYDTVLVVGLAEGAFPPPPRDDPLLPDRARSTAPGLARRGDAARRDRDDYLAALAAAHERVLTTPRADRRAQRPARPAPWLLESASHLADRVVLASELDPGHPTARHAPWLEVVASFEAGLALAPTAGSLQEHHLRSLLAWKAARRPLGRHPLALLEAPLRTGFTALAARSRRGLGPWEGAIGTRAGLAPGPERPLSATSLEQWAQCPFKYFLSRVLRVEELERPEARERLAGSDRGTIIHDVLQEFVETHPRSAPDQPWSTAERADLRAIAEAKCDAAEADGITGRAVWWELDRARLLREVDAVLDTDEWARANDGTIPYAFELGFGTAGDPLPPLTVEIDGATPVTFRGRIDRVDRTPDGSHYFVYDYKTGMPNDLAHIGDDPVMRGRRLQLALYATAVRRAFPDAGVGAYYWFTRERGDESFAGFELDDAASARLEQALSTIVGAVTAGRFPAFPGADGWWGPENCQWCAYDRVCPRDRVRRMERRRSDPALEPILTLAEDDWAPPDADPDRGGDGSDA